MSDMRHINALTTAEVWEGRFSTYYFSIVQKTNEARHVVHERNECHTDSGHPLQIAALFTLTFTRLSMVQNQESSVGKTTPGLLDTTLVTSGRQF